MNNETLLKKVKKLEHEELMKNLNYRVWYERQQKLIRQAADKHEESKKRTAELMTELGFTKNIPPKTPENLQNSR